MGETSRAEQSDSSSAEATGGRAPNSVKQEKPRKRGDGVSSDEARRRLLRCFLRAGVLAEEHPCQVRGNRTFLDKHQS